MAKLKPIKVSKARANFPGSDLRYYDPVSVSNALRRARFWWIADPTQPRDLDDLLERAAEALGELVPFYWRLFAILEAIVLLSLIAYVSLR